MASNVLTWGTGALNIDGARIPTSDNLGGGAEKITTASQKGHDGWTRPWMDDPDAQSAHAGRVRQNVERAESLGRWPANVILDEFAAAEMDRQSGEWASTPGGPRTASRDATQGATHGGTSGGFNYAAGGVKSGYTDKGGASRFYFVAKAPKSERPKVNGIAHATVKPLTLIRYLVRLVTPPGGTVLDPFAGSGTTGEAAILEGFNSILIEREADHIPLIHHRIDRATDALGLFGEETA